MLPPFLWRCLQIKIKLIISKKRTPPVQSRGSDRVVRPRHFIRGFGAGLFQVKESGCYYLQLSS